MKSHLRIEGPAQMPNTRKITPPTSPWGGMKGVTRELGACQAVSLMTGSDDTVLDDVSIRTTPLTPSIQRIPQLSRSLINTDGSMW